MDIYAEITNRIIEQMEQGFIPWQKPWIGSNAAISYTTGKPYRLLKGKRLGRKPTTKDDIPAVFYKHSPAYSAGRLNVSELARVCGLSRPTVYKYLSILA